MRPLARTILLLFVALTVAGVATAGEKHDSLTLTGNISCAKCNLKKADATECQDVLVVEGDHAGEYYLVANDVMEKFGHSCSGAKDVTVTGTVTEKDGKTWLAAEKIKSEKAEEKKG